MFRDLLSSRLIQAGLVVFSVCVAGSLVYSWHVHRTTAAELAPHARFLEERAQQKATRLTETVHVSLETEPPGFGDTPSQNRDTPMPEAPAAAVPTETERLDIADAFLPDDIGAAEEVPAAEQAVSPFGFGPYPEIPADYPGTQPSWETDLDALGYTEEQKKTAELLSRVLIKLWVEQGVGSRLGGALHSGTGRVYPFHPNTIYVERKVYRDSDGTQKGAFARIVAPGNLFLTAEETERFRLTGEHPPGIRVLSLETEGIDPYAFLNIQR